MFAFLLPVGGSSIATTSEGNFPSCATHLVAIESSVPPLRGVTSASFYCVSACLRGVYTPLPSTVLVTRSSLLLFAGLTPFIHFGEAFTAFTMRCFTLWWTFSMKYQSESCPGAQGFFLFCPRKATSIPAFLSSGNTSGRQRSQESAKVCDIYSADPCWLDCKLKAECCKIVAVK